MNVLKSDKYLPIPVISKLGRSLIGEAYQQQLFDPVQTHGVYGLTATTLPIVKEALQKEGAKRFRTVRANGKGWYILCYKSNIPNPDYTPAG